MKSKYILLYITLIGVLFTSCKKFLDQEPISTATDNTTWKSDGDANSGIAACYSLIRAALNASITYYSYGDLTSGEFSSADDASYQNVLSFNWGVAVAGTNTYDPMLKLRLYTPFYTAIAQSNRSIAFLNGMPNSDFTGSTEAAQIARKNSYLGEAYFTRAFCYFTMCRVWGDVPLVLENTTATASESYPRSPQALVLKQAIQDLNLAIKYLNVRDNSSSDRVVRADKGAAYALLAHIDAWIGDYDGCNTACDAVINSGSYSLMTASDFMNIYKGQSQESIFEIAQNNLAEGSSATVTYTLAGSTLSSPYTNNTSPNWHINTGLITQLYTDTADVRFKNAFVNIDNGTTSFYESIKYTNIQTINNNATYKVSLNNIVIFRLADIELLKAEAVWAKSGDDVTALSLVNTIRSARNAAPLTGLTGADVLQTVIDERGRELFLEGHRTFDLIRLERLLKIQQFDDVTPAEFAAGKYYWPLDPTLFITNSKLTQTAFWAGKVN